MLLEEQAPVPFPDGIWLVELAPLVDPGLVVQAVATALGVREEANRSLQVTLLEAMSNKRLLLLLDNCEHLIRQCAELAAALLRAASQVKILATSREALSVPGETAWRLPSLSLPERMQTPSVQVVTHSDAVALFVERARAVRPDFTLTDQNAGPVAQIVSRLDGIPLAIELAAARISALSAEQIAARLDDSFRLLTGGPRVALPRQQTLRAALDWSYNLLDDDERTVLRRLAVFSGGWTLGAAEAVCSDDGVEEWRVLDLLAQLVNKSLVLTEECSGETRYRLLDTVRQYARERLATAAEAAGIRTRHRDWYLALAEQAEPGLLGRQQAEWLSRIETERDNIRVALEWSASSRQDAAFVLRIASALWRFWEVRGPLSEGQRWLDESLEWAVDAPVLRMKALLASGELAYRQGNNQFGRTRFEESRSLALELDDKEGLARSAFGLSWVALHQANFDEAVAQFEESLQLWQTMGDTWGIAYSLNGMGLALADRGERERGLALVEEGFLLRRQLGDTWGLMSSMNNLGNAALVDGKLDRAREFLAEGMELARSMEYQEGIGLFLLQHGILCLVEGRSDDARSLLEEGTALFRQVGARLRVAEALYCEALLAIFTADYGRAERIHVERLGLLRDLDDLQGVAVTRSYLAYLAICQDDYVRAVSLSRDSIQVLREHHDPDALSWALAVYGAAVLGLGDQEQARQLFEESVLLVKEPVKSLGRTYGAAMALLGLGSVSLLVGRPVDAAIFLGALASLFERTVLSLDPHQRAEVARVERHAREILGDDAYARAWDEGKARGWSAIAATRQDGTP
jgi:non-specific serine/threonine protein kinase